MNMKNLRYNREAAVAYGRRWALGRNPAYFTFDGLGGDCTNFISQCIYAGTGVMNYTPQVGWFYRSASDRTASWTGVEFLYEFLVGNGSVGPYGYEVRLDALRTGDVIQLGSSEGEFYHSLMVVELKPRILVVAHSDDALNRPLSSYSFGQLRGIHIAGVRAW